MTRQQVVVGVDGTLVSVRALDRAVEEAARRGAALRVVYAVPDRDEAGPVLASAAARVRARRPGLPVVTVAAEGGAVPALASESATASLTVVGSRGLGGLAGVVFGSVSMGLAAHARGPLLVVRGDPARDGGHDVLLGLEGDADTAAADFAFQEAERRGARLRVLHASHHRHAALAPSAPVPAAAGRGPRGSDRWDEDGKAAPFPGPAGLRERYPRVDIEASTVGTGPARALLEATRDAAVVVIGARRGGRVPHLGPVTYALLHGSHCPVAVVPTDPPGDGAARV